MTLTPQSINQAVKQHGTFFFTHDLQPVVPKVGQWFCEFDLRETFDGDDEVEAGDIVEYLGQSESHSFAYEGRVTRTTHRVAAEDADCDREPRGVALILQH